MSYALSGSPNSCFFFMEAKGLVHHPYEVSKIIAHSNFKVWSFFLNHVHVLECDVYEKISYKDIIIGECISRNARWLMFS